MRIEVGGPASGTAAVRITPPRGRDEGADPEPCRWAHQRWRPGGMRSSKKPGEAGSAAIRVPARAGTGKADGRARVPRSTGRWSPTAAGPPVSSTEAAITTCDRGRTGQGVVESPRSTTTNPAPLRATAGIGRGARPSNLDHHRGKSLANLHLIAVTRPATCPRVDDPIIGSEAVIGDRSSPAERARRVLTMGRLTRWLAPQARVISPFSGASDFPPGRRACTPMTAPCQGLTHVAISR